MPKPISSTATTKPIMKMMRDRKLNFFIWHPRRNVARWSVYFPPVPTRRFL
jgi:hypothetical protein